MCNKIIVFCIISVFLVSLSGCATGRKQADLENQSLRNQISVLETQIQAKDEEISGLRDALAKTVEAKVELTQRISKKKITGEVKSRPGSKQIQIALTNAGYNPGSVDGKMGKQTRQAIKEFQKANNLSADGRVGKETWNLLQEYLDKKLK